MKSLFYRLMEQTMKTKCNIRCASLFGFMSQNYVSICYEPKIGKLSVVLQFNLEVSLFNYVAHFSVSFFNCYFIKSFFAEISDFRGGFESFERCFWKQRKMKMSEIWYFQSNEAKLFLINFPSCPSKKKNDQKLV